MKRFLSLTLTTALVVSFNLFISCDDPENRILNPGVDTNTFLLAEPSSELTISGTDMDIASKVTLNGEALAIISRNREELTVEIPSNVSSGDLVIEFESFNDLELYLKVIDKDFIEKDLPFDVFGKVDFVDPNTGFLYTNTQIYKTTNAADSWLRIYISDMLSPNAPFFALDQNIIWAPVAGEHDIMITGNGGTTWQGISVYDQINTIFEITFLSQENVLVTSSSNGNGFLHFTRDGGETWEEVYFTDKTNMYRTKVVYSTEDHIYIIDPFNYKLIRSVDGGESWNETELTINFTPLDEPAAFFLNENLGYGYSIPRINNIQPGIYKTTNGGESWTFIEEPDFAHNYEFVEHIYFKNVNEGFGITSHGGYLKTEDGGNTWRLYYFQSEPASFLDANNSNFTLYSLDEGNIIQKEF